MSSNRMNTFINPLESILKTNYKDFTIFTGVFRKTLIREIFLEVYPERTLLS